MISYGYGLVVGFGVSLLLVDHPAVGLQLLTQFAFRVRRRLMADGERCECRAKQRGCAMRGGPEAGSFAHKARPMHLLAIQVLAPEPHISPARHAPSLLVSTCNEVTAEVTAVPINYFLFLFFRPVMVSRRSRTAALQPHLGAAVLIWTMHCAQYCSSVSIPGRAEHACPMLPRVSMLHRNALTEIGRAQV